MRHFIASFALLTCLLSSASAVSDEDLGRFVEEQAEKGVSGKDLAAAIEAKSANHYKPDEPQAGHVPDENRRGLGKFVHEQLAKGLRGQDLADVIHKELKARSVGKGHGKPGGPDDAPGHSKEGGEGQGGKDGSHGGGPEGKGPPERKK